MERQRSGSSPSRLASPKSLLISFASSSLLFSFLFSLFALRFGRSLHFPFAASLGANGSAAAGPPVRSGGGGAGLEVEAEAFIGGGGGALGEDSAVEGDHRGRAGGLPVGSAMKADEAGPGGGIFETPAAGAVSGRPEVAEAGGYSPRGLDSTVEEKGVVQEGEVGEKLAKDSVSEKPKSAEGENLSKTDVVSTRSNLANASASRGAAASVEKLDRAKSAQALNFSMEASGPALGTKGGRGHAGEKGDSSVQGTYPSQQVGQWKISNRSAAKNNSGEAPVHPNTTQDANVIQEAVQRKRDLARSSIAQCDVYDGMWVFDESYPLYASNSCPFVDQGFSCEANGRTEQKYTKWRWQPRHCNIPRCCIIIFPQFHGC